MARSMPMLEGDVLLGYVDVFPLPPPSSSSSSGTGSWEVFPSKEIRISRRSPASDRCPPLAVLQVISAYSMRCKLREKTPTSSLSTLHSTCWNQRMTAVVEAGAQELHLVAMQSKAAAEEGTTSAPAACFWCWSTPAGLYAACLLMLNQRCLAVVFDLDATVLSSHNKNNFINHMKKLESCLKNNNFEQLDADRQLAICDRLSMVIKDYELLNVFNKTGTVTVDHEVVRSQPEKNVLHRPPIVRHVIRVPGRNNAVLTRLHPTDPTTSYFVNIRPGWDDLKSSLVVPTTGGCTRFKVYVCTVAGSHYALEAWRLLDPEGSLISSDEISQRLICVKPDSKNSLEHVFRKSLCHPNMAMVIDDRLDVWDEKDKRRVLNLPPYNPLAVPEHKVVHDPPVLQTVTSIIRKFHQGFFSEFDGMLLKTVDELMYENDVVDLPCTPDVGDYLQLRNNKIVGHSDAPVSPKNTS